MIDCADGTRIHAKYYAPEFKSDPSKQLAFEKNLFGKIRGQNARSESEIVMLEKTICVYRQGIDVFFIVVGSASENELVLTTVLEGMYEALNGILRSQLDKATLLNHLDLVLLCVDEVIDGGYVVTITVFDIVVNSDAYRCK